jgi:tetratricopeptide (TPR) repeat protein
MPQVDAIQDTSRRKPLLVAAAAVGAIILVIVTMFAVMHLRAPKEDAKTVMNDVRAKTFAGQDDEAIALLQGQISKSGSNQDKLSFYMQLGAIQEGKGDYAAAVDSYRSADAIQSGFGTRYAVARAAEAGGDKAVALEYYRKCQTMLKNGESKQNSDYLPLVEAALQRLGAK